MLEKNLNLKENFTLALQYHYKKKFKIAKKLYIKILKIDPMHATTHNNLGMVLKELGQLQKAADSYKQAIQIKPDYVNAHHNLGNIQKKLGKFKEAKKCYEKAIEIDSLHIPSHNNLGLVFQELGENEKAKNCFEKVIKINPNYADVYNNLGRVFHRLEDHEKAKNYYHRAIQIQPYHAKAHYNLGLIFHELEDHEKAKNYYHRAIQIQPYHVNAYNNLGIIFQEMGKFGKAKNCYQKALKYEPKNLNYYYQLSDLKKEILNLKLKNKISKIIKDDNCTEMNLAYGNFLLAKYALITRNYKKEFKYLLKGHQHYFGIEEKNFNKGIDYCLNELPGIKKLVNINRLNKKVEKICYRIKPIFIVGVPRCGSTLVEKIITSGANRLPAGEETGIFSSLLKQKMLKKHDINSDIENFLEKLVEKYKEKGLIHEKSNYTFTDKSLDNFFYLGLIKKFFLKAKIIDCRRNVLSCIVSILKKNLTKLPWAHNLEHIFKYFDNYFKIMKSYKKVYPNFIYELEYEKLVNNPEEESKKLMKFCELPWDKKCLEFYKRKDLISKTASNIQIRQAIYKHAVDKYLPYKEFFDNYRDKYQWFN